MTNSTRSIGNNAEDLACNYLLKLGFKILERNYQIRGGEIDIIARDGSELVFVEVKARWNHKFGSIEESITPWKIKALLKTALFYIQKIRWGERPYRLDALFIDYTFDKNNPTINLEKHITF